MKLDVLLTDGGYKNTYAIIRALKKERLKVGVLYNSTFSLSFPSWYVDKRYIVKTNLLQTHTPEALSQFNSEILNILQKNEIDVFMPVGNMSFNYASTFKNDLEKYAKLPVVGTDIMEVAQNKYKTFKFAEQLDIPIPKTIFIDSHNDIPLIIEEMKYPCVIKKTNFYEGGVKYCNNKDELKKNLDLILERKTSGGSFPIIQEYVEGPGTGFYGIFKDGECINYFMHERIHEFPVTGGASTFAKSIYDDELKQLGTKMLEKLRWNGVAMIEFKKDRKDNKCKLMEINPKFWGSLELSYAAGLNFPYLNYLIAMGKPLPPTASYKRDTYFRWIIPDDFIWRKFASREQKYAFKKMKKEIKIQNNLHWEDPLPIIFNLFLSIYKFFTEKHYPHGSIKKH